MMAQVLSFNVFFPQKTHTLMPLRGFYPLPQICALIVLEDYLNQLNHIFSLLDSFLRCPCGLSMFLQFENGHSLAQSIMRVIASAIFNISSMRQIKQCLLGTLYLCKCVQNVSFESLLIPKRFAPTLSAQFQQVSPHFQ